MFKASLLSLRAITAIVGLVGVLAGTAGVSSAAPVYLDPVSGLEWRQVRDTVGYSVNQMNNDGNGCSAATGACQGNLGGTGPSLAGWTWATELDVRTLFANFSGSQDIPGFNAPLSGPTTFATNNSTWAPAIIDLGDGIDTGIFLPSEHVTGTLARVFGYTRTLDPASGLYYAPRIQDGDPFNPSAFPSSQDLADTRSKLPPEPSSAARDAVGFWLYRNHEVPTPPTILLVLAGLAALGWRRRQREVAAAGTGLRQL